MENLTALKLLQFLQVLQKQTNQENPHPKNLRLYINQAETTGEKKFTKILKSFSLMQIKVVVIGRETVQLW